MRAFKIVFCAAIAFFLVASDAAAGDFDWIRDFNIRAEADASGFRAKLAARFKIGDAQIGAVLGNVDKPADAYMVMRLGEMAKRQPEEVLREYRAGKKKGWGALAKRLGIKPGSKEFHALKRGQDLYDGPGRDKKSGKEKGRGKGKNRE